MWRSIKEGKHNNFSIPGIHFGKTSETWEIIFHDSCRYDLKDNDQGDWNKLFGWSYGFHHSNSNRVVWRYNIDQDYIEVALYQYLNGKRVISDTIAIGIGTTAYVSLSNGKLNVNLHTSSGRPFRYDVFVTGVELKPTWGYNLDLFFGGDKPAPHNMKVWTRKLK